MVRGDDGRTDLRTLSQELDEHQQERVLTALGGTRATNRRYLAAFVVPSAGQSVTEEDLRTHLTEALPLPFVPSILDVVPEIPRTQNGKVDRQALVRSAGERASVPDTPRDGVDPLREQIERCWRSAIGVGPETDVEHFFRAGGSSLAAMRVVGELSRSLGVQVPLVALFRQPGLLAFTDVVRGLRPAPTDGR